MRYRKLDANGDTTFGRGPSNFWINAPAAVAQAVVTRLKLLQGEWFLDVTEGTPWSTQILGKNTSATYDPAIQERILDTLGVTKLLDYASTLDPDTRELTVTAKLDTIYGEVTVTQALQAL